MLLPGGQKVIVKGGSLSVMGGGQVCSPMQLSHVSFPPQNKEALRTLIKTVLTFINSSGICETCMKTSF